MIKFLKLIICLLFFLFVSVPEYLPAAQDEIKLIEIEVSPGDTLSKFAERYLDEPDDWPKLLDYNEIPTGDPNLIFPGDTIFVPREMVRDEIADFVEVQNQVRMRKGGQPAWRPAELGVRLYPEDGIRTSEDSLASLQYLASKSYANIGENSLVFLTPEPNREDVISMDVGQLRARDVKVLTDSAVIDPQRDSEYSAKVDEDQTTTLSVFKGSVDFISAGEKVTVEGGYMSRAEYDSPPVKPVEMPDPPEFEGRDTEPGQSPDDMLSSAEIGKDFFMDRIRISSERIQQEGAEKILLQVSADKDFSELIIDEEVDRVAPGELQEELPDGVYFWRAAFVDNRGMIGQFSAPAKFTVSTRAPEIIIEAPEDGAEISSRIVTVRGRVKPRARVSINNNPLKVESDGSFVAGINLKYGQNDIDIKATDEFGRTSEKTVSINSNLIENMEEEKGTDIFLTMGIIASVLSITAIAVAIMK